jgi:hypothetical protein
MILNESCYDENATFHDIAFDLRGRAEIDSMWRMITGGESALLCCFLPLAKRGSQEQIFLAKRL